MDFAHFLEKHLGVINSGVIYAQCVAFKFFTSLTHWRSDKKRWEGVSQIMCKHCWRGVKAYPYILTLYLEKNGESEKRKRQTTQKYILDSQSSLYKYNAVNLYISLEILDDSPTKE